MEWLPRSKLGTKTTVKTQSRRSSQWRTCSNDDRRSNAAEEQSLVSSAQHSWRLSSSTYLDLDFSGWNCFCFSASRSWELKRYRGSGYSLGKSDSPPGVKLSNTYLATVTYKNYLHFGFILRKKLFKILEHAWQSWMCFRNFVFDIDAW